MSRFLIQKILFSLPYKKAMSIAAFVLKSNLKTTTVINQAEAKAGEHRIIGWAKIQSDFETMLRLLKEYVTGKYRPVSSQFLIKVIGGVIYFLFLTDFIPDFIPGIGLVDDIAVIGWIARTIGHELSVFRSWEASR